jgi:hypothetical protein
MLRKMYLVSSDFVGDRKQPAPPPTLTTQSPQLKATIQKTRNTTTKRGRREKKKQLPHDNWIKMRRTMQEADIGRKALIQKIADFLQKVLPSCNTYAGQTVAPPETPDVKAGQAPDTASPCLPFLSRARERVYASPIKRSLTMDTDEEGKGACYVPGETTV